MLVNLLHVSHPDCCVFFLLHQPEDLTEDEDVLIGEGPKLQRHLTSQEKLMVIIGYALSRRGIRSEQELFT